MRVMRSSVTFTGDPGVQDGAGVDLGFDLIETRDLRLRVDDELPVRIVGEDEVISLGESQLVDRLADGAVQILHEDDLLDVDRWLE